MTVSVRLRNTHTHQIEVLHMFTRKVKSSYFITIIPASGLNNTFGTALGAPERPSGEEFLDDSIEVEAEPIPYRIENFSLQTLLFYQQGMSSLAERILPYHSCPYAWDEPECKIRLLELAIAQSGNMIGAVWSKSDQKPLSIGAYHLDKIITHPSVAVIDKAHTERQLAQLHTLSVNVFADGKVRVIRIADVPTIDGLGGTTQLSHSGALSPFDMEVNFAGVGVSVVQNTIPSPPVFGIECRQELIYLSIQDLLLRVTNSNQTIDIDASIRSIQLDNQLPSALYPVVLRPGLSKKDPMSAFRGTYQRFLQLSVVHSHAKSHSNFLFFPYFSLRVQKMQLNVEEELIMHLIRFGQDMGANIMAVSPRFGSSYSASAKANRQNKSTAVLGSPVLPVPSHSASYRSPIIGDKSTYQSLVSSRGISVPARKAIHKNKGRLVLYLQQVVIHPVDINISYSTMALQKDIRGDKPLRQLLWALGVTVGNFENAAFKMSALIRAEVFASSVELRDELMGHYVRQGLFQIHNIILSSNILGNPKGVLHSISTGVSQFFYEPAQGLHSPAAFGNGIARGTSSLVQHSVFGVANTSFLLLSSVSKGLTSLALAQEARPGRRDVWSGFRQGTAGLVGQPVKGFQKDGIRGLAKGGLKGAIGFVVLPASGILNLASATAISLRNFVNPDRELGRVRLPRMFQFGTLRPFADFPSPLLVFLTRYLHARPDQHFFAYCGESEASSEPLSLVLTNARVLVLVSKRGLSSRHLEVELSDDIPLCSITKVQVQSRAQILILKTVLSAGLRNTHSIPCSLEQHFISVLTKQAEAVRLESQSQRLLSNTGVFGR
jgi:vacuolar protein sorting-associated protein 13A/C